jgi:hypothetical protein
MLSTKKSAQTLVFIAFFPFITIPTAKSGFKKMANDRNHRPCLPLKPQEKICALIST